MSAWADAASDKGKRTRAFDPEQVIHKEVVLPKKVHKDTVEHLFFNPDAKSPVAAVSCKMDRGHLELALYSKAGRFDETTERLRDQDGRIYTLGASVMLKSRKAFDDPIESESHLMIGQNEEVFVDLKAHGEDVENPHLQLVSEVMTKLAKTIILSDDPAKCEALVRRIYREIPKLEAMVDKASTTGRKVGE